MKRAEADAGTEPVPHHLRRVDAIRAGDRATIARAITQIENGLPDSATLVRSLEPYVGRAHVVGITGPPGAGKSTLINAMLNEYGARGLRVAVTAVDPSSTLSGGAVLGDRVRMSDAGAAESVFIRSLASRGNLGGLASTTTRVVDVLDAAGFDIVIVETVGAGQADVDIAAVADTTVVVCPPGLGDDIQAIKAGILEIADVWSSTSQTCRWRSAPNAISRRCCICARAVRAGGFACCERLQRRARAWPRSSIRSRNMPAKQEQGSDTASLRQGRKRRLRSNGRCKPWPAGMPTRATMASKSQKQAPERRRCACGWVRST